MATQPSCPACAQPLEVRRVSQSRPDGGRWQAVLDGPLRACCVNAACPLYLRAVA
ncbi:hypothetical protein [Demequina silvatica]|uniref:hypothetical protein n=1 Tax=Demequina silvatica TaxID=1638988 RepID=UPI000B1D205A|nr:hypothetical protein [Demequina silvatica]